MRNEAFEFEQDWGKDGVITWRNAKTIGRYLELRREQVEMEVEKYRCFFAFDKRRYEQGVKAIGLKDGERVVQFGFGGYGAEEGVKRMLARIKEIDGMIREDCDPQEVYCYEYNNHESFLAFDGDVEAVRIVEGIFGSEVAVGIKRFNAFYR